MSNPVPDLDRLAPEAAPGIRILPVVHERIEMTAVVRSALDGLDPAGVALELPTTLAETARAAIGRLPRISLVVTQEPGEDALVWVVAPGDPFAEALRWARERDRRVFCVDPDLPYSGRHADPVPDPYSVWRLGPEAYLGLLAQEGRDWEADETDRRREAGMAYHLAAARDRLAGGRLLALVGAAHAARIADDLQRPAAHPFARTRRTSIELRHLAPSGLTGLLPDPPLAHAVWERLRTGEPPAAVALEDALSRKVSIVRYGLTVIAGEGGEGEARRKRSLVDHACRGGTRRTWSGTRFPDRGALERVVWRVGSGSWREQTGESAGPWQRRLFFDFAGRCARAQGQLAAGLYEWVVAARGVGDDNLAWEVFDAARTYPWQQERAEIPTATLDGSDLDLGTRKVRFRRRFFRVKSRPIAIPVREHRRPENPEDWLRAFAGGGLCSYPPEDLVIEDYGRFLQRKAVGILSAERSRSEPFSTSLLDGVDIRETLRRFQEGRIYVRERGRAPGKAGSVVVILDPDPRGDRFPFTMTWHGEHDQESDMAFYATAPGDQVVGPGILRATYGGFMLTLPRGRLLDVWSDPDYRFARGKAQLLLMAAVDYSLDPIVVHVGKEPPGERMRRYAGAQKKRIVHIPLASLSPVTLRKIRVLHILAGKDKRAVARDYVW